MNSSIEHQQYTLLPTALSQHQIKIFAHKHKEQHIYDISVKFSAISPCNLSSYDQLLKSYLYSRVLLFTGQAFQHGIYLNLWCVSYFCCRWTFYIDLMVRDLGQDSLNKKAKPILKGAPEKNKGRIFERFTGNLIARGNFDP